MALSSFSALVTPSAVATIEARLFAKAPMSAPNTQLLVRKLPGLPGRQTMQFENLDGQVLWTAPLDDRIAKILKGRWSCTLNAYANGQEMEILGEAPPTETTLAHTSPSPPHTLRLTQDRP